MARATARINQALASTSAGVGNFARSFAAPLTALGAALGTSQLVKMTGQWTDLTSRVNLAAGSMEKGTEVMGRLGEMARRTYSDLTQTAEGYMAFSTVLGDLGVNTEKQLGLYAPKLVDANDQAGQSLDELVGEDRLEKIRKMREELERLRGSALLNPGDNFAKIANEASDAMVYSGSTGKDDVLLKIHQLAADLKAGSVEAEELATRLDDIRKIDMDEPARKLFNRLIEVSALGDGLNTALRVEGATAEIDAANAALQAMKDALDNGIRLTDAQITEMAESNLAADEARRESGKGGGGGKKGGKGKTSGIDSLLAELRSKEEILTAWYDKSLELLNKATEDELAALGGRAQAIERLEKEHADRLAEISHEKNDQRLSEAGSFFGSMAALAQAGGDKLAKGPE